jgi:hypothetical protein
MQERRGLGSRAGGQVVVVRSGRFPLAAGTLASTRLR